MKTVFHRCLVLLLVLVLSGTVLIAPALAKPTFDFVSDDISPFSKTAPIMLESIRKNDCMDDTVKIKSTIELYLRLNADQICNWMYADFDYSPFFDEQSDNYQNLLHIAEKNRAIKQAWKRNLINVLWSNLDIAFETVELSRDSATVSLSATLKFIEENNSKTISSFGMLYYIQMKNLNGIWMICNIVTSDDPNYKINHPELFKNETKFLKQSSGEQFEIEPSSAIDINQDTTIDTEEEASLRSDPYWTSQSISGTNFIYYALAHASSADYNSNFRDYNGDGGDCTNFASQCIWYGLGGIDDYNMISNCSWPMVSLGMNNARNWYQKGTLFASDEAHAWVVADELYLNAISGGYHIDGLNGTHYTGIANATTCDIIQADWDNDDDYDHSFVVVGVAGTSGSRTAQDITVCCHSPDYSSMLLSTALASLDPYGMCSLRTLHIINSWRFIEPYKS